MSADVNICEKRRKTEDDLRLHELVSVTHSDSVCVRYVSSVDINSRPNENGSAVCGCSSDASLRPQPSDAHERCCENCHRIEDGSRCDGVESQTFKDLQADVSSIENLLRSHGISAGFVAVGVAPGCLLPVAILGILRVGCGFYPLSWKKPFSDYNLSRVVVQFQWLVSDSHYFDSSGVQADVVSSHDVQMRAGSLHLLKLRDCTFEHRTVFYSFQYAYAIRTSGTTGNRRVVFVPHRSIVRNVLDLVKRFGLTSSDTVLAIAPPTFDPSIVDLFMALYVGAPIVYMAEKLRLVPSDLLKAILKERVTFMQCTPSFLLRFGVESLKDELFGARSNLRNLALGGEKCVPRSFLRRVIPSDRRDIQVYNLYGITEVSCWATVEQVDLAEDGCDEVSLGQPLDSICLKLLPSAVPMEGEIVIGFGETRQCKVFSESGKPVEPFLLETSPSFKFFQTGDHGRYVGNGILYVDRLDRIRKRNGIKVDLGLVEASALQVPGCLQAFCVDWKDDIVLAVRLRPDCDKDAVMSTVYEKLRNNLPFESYPDRIVFTAAELPLNENDKLNWSRILEEGTSRRSNTQDFTPSETDFQKIFYTLWNFYTRRVPSIEPPSQDCNFIMEGGDSISVNLFVEDFFDKIQKFGSTLHVESEKLVKCALMKKTAAEVESILLKIVIKAEYKCAVTAVDDFEPTLSQNDVKKTNVVTAEASTVEQTPFCIKLPQKCIDKLAIPVGLCVDATPVIAPHPTEVEVCLVGSHSGSLHCFSLSKLNSLQPWKESSESVVERVLVWMKRFPGRIESSPVVDRESCSGYLGCHDGKLYKFSIIDGSVHWTFDAAMELRASPALSEDSQHVVVTTSKVIYCLDSASGTLHWIKSSEAYIFQTLSPTVSNDLVFFVSVVGMVALSLKDGSVAWTFNLANIRTSPLPMKLTAVRDGRKISDLVAIGDSKGIIHAVSQADGTKIWSSSVATESTPNQLTFHHHDASDGEGRDSWLFCTTQDGHMISLDPLTGCLIHQVHVETVMRCRPIVFDVWAPETSISQRSKCRCCCIFNSKDGRMFFCELSRPPSSIYKLFDYGSDKAESFSSPAFSTRFSIILIGSRDNCVHIAKLS